MSSIIWVQKSGLLVSNSLLLFASSSSSRPSISAIVAGSVGVHVSHLNKISSFRTEHISCRKDGAATLLPPSRSCITVELRLGHTGVYSSTCAGQRQFGIAVCHTLEQQKKCRTVLHLNDAQRQSKFGRTTCVNIYSGMGEGLWEGRLLISHRVQGRHSPIRTGVRALL